MSTDLVCPSEFAFLKNGADGAYISHFKVQGDLPMCVVSTSALFLCDVANSVKWKKTWFEVYSISSVDGNGLHMDFINPKGNQKNPLIERILYFETQNQRDLWFIVFRRLQREAAQQYYEAHWIPEPQIYQMHRVCLKYTNKGKRTQITVALSNTKLYLFNNQGKNVTLPKEVIGTCQISAIKSIAAHSNCDTLLTIVGPSSLLGGTGKIDVDLILRFFNPEDAKWFFQELSRLYFNFHKQPPQKNVRKLLRTDSIKEGIKAGFV